MSYEPTNWKKGDKVTSTRLNKIEQGIQGNDIEASHLKEDLSAKTKNSVLSFIKQTVRTLNVSIDCDGLGRFKVYGTPSSNGGRTARLSQPSTLEPGTYSLIVYTGTTNAGIIAYINNTNNDVIANTSSFVVFTISSTTEVYLGLSFVTSHGLYDDTVEVMLVKGDTIVKIPFVPYITAADIVARLDLDTAKSDVDTLDGRTAYTYTFEQGTISGNGSETSNNNRIRTKEYFLAKGITASVDPRHRIWCAEYDSKKAFIKITTSSVTKWEQSNLDSNTAFVKFVVVNVNGNTAINPTDETGFTVSMKNMPDTVSELISSVSELKGVYNRHFSAFKRYAFLLDGASAHSDATIVGNSYVSFSSGSDDLTTDVGSIYIDKYENGFDGQRTSTKTLKHLFGHCNTVDYNEQKDCLIMGNGSGSYTLNGKIFIIPNFSDIVNNDAVHTTAENPLTLSNTNAVVIDCTEYNLGTKFNVLWGEIDGTRADICYLITAKYGSNTSASDAGDNGTIRRILLGTGANELEYGSIVEAESGEFNGTFKILDTYTQKGTSYAQCNQGSCFYDGKVFACIGHDGLWTWAMWLDNTDMSIHYDEHKQKTYNVDGSAIGNNQANASGICVSDKYMFIGQASVGVLAIPI